MFFFHTQIHDLVGPFGEELIFYKSRCMLIMNCQKWNFEKKAIESTFNMHFVSNSNHKGSWETFIKQLMNNAKINV